MKLHCLAFRDLPDCATLRLPEIGRRVLRASAKRRITRLILFAALALSGPAVARPTRHVLQPVGEVGVRWRLDHPGWMSFVAFSPKGDMIASDGATTPDDVSNGLSLWSFPGGRLIRRLPGGSPDAFSPDWKYYATRHGVRRVADGTPAFAGSDYAVQAFTSDSANIIRSEPGHGISMISLADGKTVRSFGTRDAFALAASPDGETIAAGHWTIVTLWRQSDGRRLAILRGVDRYATSLAFSDNGRLLAVGNDLGGLQIWDVRRRTRLHAIQLPGQIVSTPAFSRNGRFIAVGTYGSGTVWLIDARTGRTIDSRQVSGMGCGSAAFSPDGRFLITPSTGGLVTWPYDRGGAVKVFRVGRGLVKR